MSVDIEPYELNFRRPFTTEVSQILKIKNPNTVPVAFKVKTTAPKQYCVRPNAGRIEPGQDFDVTVLLQAMKADPAPDARCRDKFLVQSASITSDKEFASIAAVLDTTQKGQLQERKIRVNWLSANPEHDEGASRPIATPNKPAAANGFNDTPDVNRTFSSPGATTNDSAGASGPPPYTSDDATSAYEDDRADDRSDVKSAISQAATTASATVQLTYEELKNKLVQAEAQLASFKDSGLRQRNVKTSGDDGEKKPFAESAQAVRQTVEGVPVQIVAILCLISFLLAYFFF